MLDTAKAGAWIAELRRQAKFTQESLAERLGVLPQAVSKWETGNAMPEVALLCALAETNELGMFVNPARWDDDFAFRVLIIGDKTEATITDRDTLAYALQVLDKTEAGDKAFGLTKELIAGDKALRAWLDACDTDENTYVGFPGLGTYGIVNNPNVFAHSVATGAGGGTSWDTKDQDEILDDVNAAINETWAQSGYDLQCEPAQAFARTCPSLRR